MSRWNNKIVIFDLDGTLADITARRTLSTKDNGKMDWDVESTVWFNMKKLKFVGTTKV